MRLGDPIAEGDQFGHLDLDDLASVEADHEIAGFAAVDELVVGLLIIEEDALDNA